MNNLRKTCSCGNAWADEPGHDDYRTLSVDKTMALIERYDGYGLVITDDDLIRDRAKELHEETA